MFGRGEKRLWFMTGRKRKLDLVISLDQHQPIPLALPFVIAQFDDVLDAWILQAGNVHLYPAQARALPEQNKQDRNSYEEICAYVNQLSWVACKIEDTKIGKDRGSDEDD